MSAALGWEPEYLNRVLKGRSQQSGNHATPDLAAVWSRLGSFGVRLAELAGLLAGLKSRIAMVIDHARDG